MKKLKKFNEKFDDETRDRVSSHLDEESMDHYEKLHDMVESDMNLYIHESAFTLEEYTIGAEGEMEVGGTSTTEAGTYKWELKITRID